MLTKKLTSESKKKTHLKMLLLEKWYSFFFFVFKYIRSVTSVHRYTDIHHK